MTHDHEREAVELENCPFCGGEAKLEEWHKSNYVTENGHKCPECWMIGCQRGLECPGYSRALHKTREQAIAWWKSRAADPLRQKLGPTAVEAIMEGKAAVVISRLWDGEASRVEYTKQNGGGFYTKFQDCRLDIPASQEEP